MKYVVRSANWKMNIEIEQPIGDEEFQFSEAATRAIEKMYEDGDIETFDGGKAKIGAAIQVCLLDHDFDSHDLTAIEIQKRVDNKEVKYMYSPTILANAGKHDISTYLLSILEESDN